MQEINAQIVTIRANSEAAHLVDRLLILSGDQQLFHPSVHSYDRRHIADILKKTDNSWASDLDKIDQAYLRIDNAEWINTRDLDIKSDNAPPQKQYIDSQSIFYNYPSIEASHKKSEQNQGFLGVFYKTPAHLIESKTKDFHITVDPLLNFKVYSAENDNTLFENQRGLALRGSIDNKLFYYVTILETQSRPAKYIRDFEDKFKAIPGAGFYKTFSSTIFNSENAFDYFIGEGHFGIDVTKHISLKFGHGNQFIGNGIRSLLLSDFSTNRLFLQFDTRVWKFHYQNIFTQLQIQGARDDVGDQLIPTKYMATHYLTFEARKNLNIGVFESVIFSRSNQFELQYLNPLIFYRTVEGSIGSPDNVIVGLNVDWTIAKRFNLYSQVIVDEFKLSELIQESRGWWGNKLGLQLGLKYINALGIDHLDLQAEFNSTRPYTYSHRDSTSNYSHYNQALAHPLGANFNEFVFKLKYVPAKKWMLNLTFMSSETGDDPVGENFGSNVLIPNGSIPIDRPFGNNIGQGISTDIFIAGVDLSYNLYHKVFLDMRYFYRKKDSVLDVFDQSQSYFGGGIRINLDQKMPLF